MQDSFEKATFAGGCFWCIEDVFQDMDGVIKVVSGYSGGDAASAKYHLVARGMTEHREAVQITYNPSEVSYEDLLKIFWRQIDPTDADGQFADRGHQYTTAILFHTAEQEAIAEASKDALEESGPFDEPIVTEIIPFESFFPAEEDHQQFSKKCPLYYQSYKKGSGRAAFIEDTWNETH